MSPWSVLKVSLLFYACLWVIFTIASVLLWRVGGRAGCHHERREVPRPAVRRERRSPSTAAEIFRASTLAGVILVFAGTGFTVLMSLLFNVICDITGGIRFTVLELESTKRLVEEAQQQVASPPGALLPCTPGSVDDGTAREGL